MKTKDSKKELDDGDSDKSPEKKPMTDDPLREIRNEDKMKRICQRKEEEDYFDLLLSGTSATLIV